jgi:type I restriction enzyme M protein
MSREKLRPRNPYDVYQHLMDYWAETMQDDVYQIALDGWKAIQGDGPDRGKPNTDLIPEPLIVARYFAKEREAIDALEADRDAVARQLEELDEEHGGEEGPLFEAKTDKGKLTRASVTARLKELMYDKDAAEERQTLQTYVTLIEKEAAANKRIKDAQQALDAQVAGRYSRLTPDEIRSLVVDDKWLARLAADVQGELMLLR